MSPKKGRDPVRSPGRRKATQGPDTPGSRQAILDAALRVFARNGYDGASMPGIARVAGVAPPLIHYYFGSKENLWRETVAHSLADIRRDAVSIANATRALAPLDRLRAFLQAITHHAARWPDNFVMIIAEARADSDRYAWVHEHYTGVIFRELTAILDEAKDRQVINDIDMEQLASLLVGGILVYFTVNPVLSGRTDEKELDRIAGEYTDLVFGVLLRGVARSGESA